MYRRIGYFIATSFEYSKKIIKNSNYSTHRDLKPANILIKDGVYKLADFGFSTHVDN